MTRLLVSALALGLAVVAATPAFANSIWTEDCNLTPQSSFGFNEAVCAQGDLDSPCLGSIIAAADIWIMPSGAPDFTLAPGSLPSRIVTAGGAGGFWGEYIWLPPLVPGTYDLLIDEACNGTWNADDLRVNGAFVVNNVDTGVVVDVAAIKGDALQQAAEWGQIRANFNLMVDVVSLIGKLNTFVSALGGDFSGVIGWIYGKVTGLPTDYNGAVLQIGKEIVGGMTTAMETHFILLALDPPDPDYEVLVTLDWSVLELFTSDEGLFVYLFALQGSTAVEAQSLRLAGVLAEQAVLGDAFVRSLEKY